MYTIKIYLSQGHHNDFQFFVGGIESLSGILVASKESSTPSWMLNQTSLTNNPQEFRIPGFYRFTVVCL